MRVCVQTCNKALTKESIVAQIAFLGVSNLHHTSWCHVVPSETHSRRNLSELSPKEAILESKVQKSPTQIELKRRVPGSHMMQEIEFGGCPGMAGPAFCP
jgi:hypothetical protein